MTTTADKPLPTQEGVVVYHDGARWRYGDSWAIRRRLWTILGPRLPALLEAIGRGQGDGREVDAGRVNAALESADVLFQGVRKAFALEPFDPTTGQGASDAVCLEALRSWLDAWGAEQAVSHE